MTKPSVSVVIVSRGRPDALTRCLLGVSQLQYDPFEVIVVADPAGLEAVEKLPFAEALKQVPFDEANISAARNHGIMQAAGEIVAFIDDDAVPEPQWLHFLTGPYVQSAVAATGGFVRGRNGISFQWKARSIDRFGGCHPLEIDENQASVLHPPKGSGVKTEGTNMAFRRNVLIELGGFDPAFHYYLDETDLNLRLGRAGHATAIVPMAEVHHGFAENALRTANRAPKDLFDIGASWAVFQRKHIPEAERAKHWKGLRAHERARVLRHMVSGGLEPRDVRRLMKRLDQGYSAGKERSLGPVKLAAHSAAPFKGFPSRPRTSVTLSSRPMRFKEDHEKAAARVKKDEIVTVISLSVSAMFHQLSFHESGVWVQRGGIFGKSNRSGPIFRMTTRSRRLEKEKKRVARQRGFRD